MSARRWAAMVAAAGRAMAVEPSGLAQSPESAAEMEQLREQNESYRIQLNEMSREYERLEVQLAEQDKFLASVGPEIERLNARIAELEAAHAPAELTIYRAEYESFVFGLYTTAEAAREHCETYERRDQPTAVLDWIEDEEEGVAELVAAVDGQETTTGYVVTALEVASAYDPDGDE